MAADTRSRSCLKGRSPLTCAAESCLSDLLTFQTRSCTHVPYPDLTNKLTNLFFLIHTLVLSAEASARILKEYRLISRICVSWSHLLIVMAIVFCWVCMIVNGVWEWTIRCFLVAFIFAPITVYLELYGKCEIHNMKLLLIISETNILKFH